MLVTDPLTIRRHYLRSWFIIDLCSALPFNYIVLLVEHSEDDANLSRTTRFMRLTRIMRFARLLKLAKLTQLRDAIDTFQKFLNNVGISAMEVEFCEGCSARAENLQPGSLLVGPASVLLLLTVPPTRWCANTVLRNLFAQFSVRLASFSFCCARYTSSDASGCTLVGPEPPSSTRTAIQPQRAG